MKKQLAWGIILGIVSMMLLMSCVSLPESQASASATVMGAQQINAQASVSLNESAHGTQTAIAASANGTLTAQALSFDATRTVGTRSAEETTTVAARTESAHQSFVGMTQTAEPHNAALVANRAQNEMQRETTLTLGLFALVVIGILIGLAMWQLVRTRASIISRNAAGQLPALRVGDTIINPGQELGPVTVHSPSRMLQVTWIAYVVWCLVNRRMPDLTKQPHVTIETTDSHATADHRLAAHDAAQLPTAVAAMFQPWEKGNTGDRADRLKLGQQTSRMPLAQARPEALPASIQPRIIDVTEQPDRVREIATALGHQLPEGDAAMLLDDGTLSELNPIQVSSIERGEA